MEESTQVPQFVIRYQVRCNHHYLGHQSLALAGIDIKHTAAYYIQSKAHDQCYRVQGWSTVVMDFLL